MKSFIKTLRIFFFRMQCNLYHCHPIDAIKIHNNKTIPTFPSLCCFGLQFFLIQSFIPFFSFFVSNQIKKKQFKQQKHKIKNRVMYTYYQLAKKKTTRINAQKKRKTLQKKKKRRANK